MRCSSSRRSSRRSSESPRGGVKNAIGEIKEAISKLETSDKENAAEIAKVRGELNDLKADLPLIYVTREDFIRVSNNIDHKLDKLLYRGERKEE